MRRICGVAAATPFQPIMRNIVGESTMRAPVTTPFIADKRVQKAGEKIDEMVTLKLAVIKKKN